GDGPGSVNERIQDAVSQAVDALAYDPATAYGEGDTVRGGPSGPRLYQALQPVPVDTPPPNVNYWMDIGEVVETASGLAVRVEQNETSIEELDGQITATASSLDVLRANARPERADGELADALRGWQTQAQYAQEVRVRDRKSTRLNSSHVKISYAVFC